MTDYPNRGSHGPSKGGGLRAAWPALALAAACLAALLWANQPLATTVPWRTDLEAALAQAAAQDRYIFIEFDSPGCRFCRRMDEEVFSRSEAAEALQGFISVRLDLDRHPGQARRFGVQAVPTFIVLSPQGRVLAATTGAMSLKVFKQFVDRTRS